MRRTARIAGRSNLKALKIELQAGNYFRVRACLHGAIPGQYEV
jgi:hypothetical protein